MRKEIASIYFAEVSATRALYGGYYKIPAVPKGAEPVILTIDDKIQRSQEPGLDGRSRTMRRDLIDGRDIANDILAEWNKNTVGMTPTCRPGIWIVRDEVPLLNNDGTPEVDADHRAVWRSATPAERKAMWDEDLEESRIANANWADYLITSADVLDEDPKQRVLIGPLNKVAARYFGKERAWLQELKDSDIKHCPFCTKAISIAAVKCQHCQEVVDIERYAEMTRARDAAVEAARSGAIRPPVRPAVKAS